METKRKARPILMSAPMVLALLAGRKTQTRRLIKITNSVRRDLESPEAKNIRCENGGILVDWLGGRYAPLIFSPYGKVGDFLWVRETRWRNGGYVATDNPGFPKEGKLPSIFMKRLYSRLTLEITRIRVQRLHDINEADAKKEGADPISTFEKQFYHGYRVLWQRLHGCKSWDDNPWVWVIHFKTHHKNVDAL